MSKELNNLLKQAYIQYKDFKDPPVPIHEIKAYLKLEGIEIDSENSMKGNDSK